ATVLAALAAAGVTLLSRVVPPGWGRWGLAAAAAVGWGGYAVALVGAAAPGLRWAVVGLVALGAAWAGHRLHGRWGRARGGLPGGGPALARAQAGGGRAVARVEEWAADVPGGTLRAEGRWLLGVCVGGRAGRLRMGEGVTVGRAALGFGLVAGGR